MGSFLEPVPITSQKHDPAWKHCQMFKSGDKIQLKCLYCTKLFKGGGIHRIKEHLAGQKGNAATCPRVPPEVRSLMQQSLDGVVVKKRNRQKLDQEITVISQNNAGCNGVVEPDSNLVVASREAEPTVIVCGRKRGRGRNNNNSNSNNNNGNRVGFKNENGFVQMAIGRFLYDIGAPLDSVNSPYFEPMIEAIASSSCGVGSLPSYHDLRGWILKNSVEEARTVVDKHRTLWEKTGCSLHVEERRTMFDSVLLSFTVSCPEGAVFLKTVEASGPVHDSIGSVVEEIGPANVVQVITSSDKEQYVVAGKRLSETFPSLYWAPCAVSLIDSILENFGNLGWISETVDQARSVTRFVYNHSEVLNMVRQYTYCNDIVELGITRISTNFATLKRLVKLKHSLQAVVNSQEWVDCPCSKKPSGLDFSDFVMNQPFWTSCNSVVNLTRSLLQVVRIVSDEKRPAMGFVYAAMYRAKEAIKRELVKKDDYLVYWDIIDRRWEYHWSFPLHAAGFYLNPKFFYGIKDGDYIHNATRSGLFDCIERLIPDTEVQDKIIKEINLYKNAAGDFGRKMAIRTRETLLPAEWWSIYGGGCPNLAHLAIQILSQSCSVIQCNNRNQDFVRRLHETENSLEQQRLSDLVFVQNNLGLRKTLFKTNGQDFMDPISLDRVCVVEEWVRRLEDDHVDSDWTVVDPPSIDTLLLGPMNDDAEDLGTGFEDYEILSRVKDGEDDNVVIT